MGRRKVEPVCNRDCFHCPHPDCIVDDMSQEEYRESLEREGRARRSASDTRTPEQIERERARARAYYKANREKILAKAKAYREEHREEVNARERARYLARPEVKKRWDKTHPEQVKAIQRKSYRKRMANETPEHRAKRLAYQKAYREARKLRANTDSASS